VVPHISRQPKIRLAHTLHTVANQRLKESRALVQILALSQSSSLLQVFQCSAKPIVTWHVLLELAPELPLHTAFKVADEILTNSVKGIAELITTSGLVNLDFADIRAVMSNGGVSLIGIGESASSSNRAEEAVERAINNPLLDVNIQEAKGALINIIGGPDLTLEEYKLIMEMIGSRISADAKIISGAQISADMEKSIKILLIVTGVKSSQILGSGTGLSINTEEELEGELGINFVDK